MINALAPLDLSLFKHSYAEARHCFLEHLNRPLPIQWQQRFEHPLLGAQDEALFCDMVLLSQSKKPRKILVIQSATHGIEGYMGSAVQSDLLPLLEVPLFAHADLGILLIHALNPWGFSWQRRGDHQNIDLNRNFVDFSQPLPHNSQYDELAATALHIWQTRKTQAQSIAPFIGTVTQGQYHNPEGIFYGGQAPSWSNGVLQQLKSQGFWQSAKHIAVLDLHTGLGPYGYGELINDHQPNSRGFESVVNTYGANACSAYLGESCSAPKNGLVDFFWHQLIGERGHFVTVEFGTFAPEALVGLLLEEQDYQNHLGTQTRDLDAPPVKALLNFFYPFEPSWQQQVLLRSRQVVNLALQNGLKKRSC
ncbi:hypothetical protein THMIRHAS_02380 [Thiosulfatimonas sediminis]|uniref:DUF2817 domain-containing protein n=1 Tax=Thiosulfatimonas sediminis TaxID=2675054 RepID=A0A6F8PRX1_9GAMM|nr:DUF2817 domain-containing protein [Thiosulfatimonas sediminis]BBP44865.1 hypothetical protein THMIRHAS_02380 [Thiosulfatimonas sediminis]